MATMVALSSFAGAAVVGRYAAGSSSLAPRRHAVVVRAQSEPEMDPSKETASPSTSSPSPISSPTPRPVAPKPKANPSVRDVLAFSGPAPERINGRLAMVGFVVPLLQGRTVESKSSGVWSADAELWNGRFAMLGLVALAATEFITGTPFVNV